MKPGRKAFNSSFCHFSLETISASMPSVHKWACSDDTGRPTKQLSQQYGALMVQSRRSWLIFTANCEDSLQMLDNVLTHVQVIQSLSHPHSLLKYSLHSIWVLHIGTAGEDKTDNFGKQQGNNQGSTLRSLLIQTLRHNRFFEIHGDPVNLKYR